jgi:hypothetical protein
VLLWLLKSGSPLLLGRSIAHRGDGTAHSNVLEIPSRVQIHHRHRHHRQLPPRNQLLARGFAPMQDADQSAEIAAEIGIRGIVERPPKPFLEDTLLLRRTVFPFPLSSMSIINASSNSG